jgi:hypothetical protein
MRTVTIPWVVLDNTKSLMTFADRIALTPLRRAHRTSVSGAIDAAANLFEVSGLEATRKVIDVSGDGVNNQGRPAPQTCDEAVARGITINDLPIMLEKPGSLDDPDPDIYFRDCVIGGQGAFMMPARDKSQFQEAIKAKILLEVSSVWPPTGSLIRPAQEDAIQRAGPGDRNGLWAQLPPDLDHGRLRVPGRDWGDPARCRLPDPGAGLGALRCRERDWLHCQGHAPARPVRTLRLRLALGQAGGQAGDAEPSRQALSPSVGAVLIEWRGPDTTLVALAGLVFVNCGLVGLLWMMCRPARPA